MQLSEMRIKDYIELLGSEAMAPGGGSASALCGSQGAALFTMVARLTVNKAKYADFHEVCNQVIVKGEGLYKELCDSVDKDTEAFNLVAEAYKLPKETDEQKTERSKAVEKATIISTEVPFKTMELGLEGLTAAKTLLGKSNPNTASDLGVAAQNLLACVKGAWLNVLINLGGIKDEALTEKFRKNGRAIVDEAFSIANEIFSWVENSL